MLHDQISLNTIPGSFQTVQEDRQSCRSAHTAHTTHRTHSPPWSVTWKSVRSRACVAPDRGPGNAFNVSMILSHSHPACTESRWREKNSSWKTWNEMLKSRCSHQTRRWYSRQEKKGPRNHADVCKLRRGCCACRLCARADAAAAAAATRGAFYLVLITTTRIYSKNLEECSFVMTRQSSGQGTDSPDMEEIVF